MTRHAPRPRKRFGQHFLEPQWAAKVVTAINPSPRDVFIEVGPGRGALTVPLAASGARIVAIEIDRDLSASLRALRIPNLEILTADVLDVDLGELASRATDGALRLVGNLPYYISTPVLFRLLSLARDRRPITDATLMLQREVAERLAARPGTKTYGVLSVLTAPVARVTPLLTLPPGAFRPMPRVASALVRLTFHAPELGAADPVAFERLVRRLFSQRRKMIGTLLRDPGLGRGRDVTKLIAEAGLDPRQRPETLELADLTRLTELLAVQAGPPVL